jgi:hypothetical protein
LHLSGFTNAAIRIFDITDALNIFELSPKVVSNGGSYEATVGLAVSGPAVRTILVFASDAVSAPVSVSRHFPKFLDDRRVGADIVIVTHPDFVESLTPLAPHRESDGQQGAVVTTEQIYDEYNTGERSPFAIRSFLMDAARRWQRKPQVLLLVGDASFDPSNYLGLGNFEFVPRMIETAAFKTASDDWFSDFQQTGYATLATGRLPVRTAANATCSLLESLTTSAEFLPAPGMGGSFLLETRTSIQISRRQLALQQRIPPLMQVSRILTDGLDATAARAQVIMALNNGALLVDYQGHGAEQQWSFVDLFDSTDAAALTNGGRMPVYLFYSGDYMSTEDGGSPLIRIGPCRWNYIVHPLRMCTVRPTEPLPY